MGILDDDAALLRLINAAQYGSNVNSASSARSTLFGLGGTPSTGMPGNWLAEALGGSSAASIARWEDKIEQWSAEPSDSEHDRIDRTIRMIHAAISEDIVLKALNPTIKLQGSYRNQTNTKLESDIDVCVLFDQTAYNDFAPGYQYSTTRAPALYTPDFLKEQLRLALVRKFDGRSVKAGTKALQVKPSTVRVDADVVAAVEYNFHYTDTYGRAQRVVGTAIPIGNSFATNFPDDHHRLGVAKNIDTQGTYKMMVRFFKRMNQEFTASDQLPSFYIESLIFNCSRECFFKQTYYTVACAVLKEIQTAVTSTYPPQWKEANGLKMLWHTCPLRGGNFSIGDAERFVSRAKREMGI